jgi:hypothetical protein
MYIALYAVKKWRRKMLDKEKVMSELSWLLDYFENHETDRDFYYEINHFLFRIKSDEFDVLASDFDIKEKKDER